MLAWNGVKRFVMETVEQTSQLIQKAVYFMSPLHVNTVSQFVVVSVIRNMKYHHVMTQEISVLGEVDLMTARTVVSLLSLQIQTAIITHFSVLTMVQIHVISR